MKKRILLWAMTGVAIAAAWAIYAYAAGPEVNIAANPILWIVAQVSCPIVLLGTHFHFGVRLEWVLLANALVYGLIGAISESVRHKLRPAT